MSWVSFAVGVFWLSLLLIPNNVDQYGRPDSPRVLWPLLLPIGLMFILGACAMWMNKAAITARKDSFVFRSGPFPIKRVTFDPTGVKQFFVSRPARAISSSTLGRALSYIDSQDHLRTLTASFPSYHSMNQVAHELQDFYGLEDLPIYGETAKAGPRNK